MDFSHEKFILQINLNQRIMEIKEASFKKKNTIERKEFMRQVGIGGDKLDFTLNLNQMANNSLNSKGGFVVSQNVIIARTLLDDNFLAVAAACTHEGIIISYRANSNDFKCPKHGSEFTSAGAVQAGPATAALTKYKTAFDKTANTLRIFE